MTNSKVIFQDLMKRITIDEDHDEIQSMAYWVLEHVAGLTKADIVSEKLITYEPMAATLEDILNRLNRFEPLQYILGEAYFYNRKFKVDPAVLIPRAETEELVRSVLEFARQCARPARILDIGTGSGCIAVTLALESPQAMVLATDISTNALRVARENADRWKANVQFAAHDILGEELSLRGLDAVVSNPPYVLRKEKAEMKENVVQYEPHLALFVPDDDPLLFYKAIAEKSYEALRQGGLLNVEVNEKYAEAVAKTFEDRGYAEVQIVRDLYGKSRMVSGHKP